MNSDEHQAFELFFSNHYERLLRTIFLVTGDPNEAEEVVQEAFVRVFERWSRVRAMDNPTGYLYRTAVNAHRNTLRRLERGMRRRALRVDADPIAESDDRDEIRRLLSSLPAGQREAVVLVEWAGMSDAEAGKVLRISPGAVRVRVHRAHESLRLTKEVSHE